MAHTVKILAVENVTHDVKRLVVERPDGYTFKPGQATDVAVNKPDWRKEQRPFTFTSLASNPNLEFTIKIYKDHHGQTEQLGQLEEGDELIIDDAWGAIQYKGPGTFIAGGAGVTPFVAILRDLERQGQLEGNRLLFSNRTAKDIIMRGEWVRMLGDAATFTLTREQDERFAYGRIDSDFIKQCDVDLSGHFYVCGPPKMVEDVTAMLKQLGVAADSVVIES